MRRSDAITAGVRERIWSQQVTRRQARRRPAHRWLLGLAALLVAMLVLGALWSRPPAPFDLDTLAPAGPPAERVPGTQSVRVAIRLGETLLHKPGGFLYNDRLPPGVLLDNVPSWECGNLMALRDFVQALRQDFSRTGSQSLEHSAVREADLRLAMDPKSWLLPTPEAEYAKGLAALRAYLAELERAEPNLLFSARADTLAAYLAIVEKRLGGFGARLAANVPDANLAVLASQPLTGAPVSQPGNGQPPLARTPWHQVDNTFYCARGYSYALFHLLQGLSSDFSQVMANKGGDAAIGRIVLDLQGATRPLRSPLVLNGGAYGMLANHSLVLSAYIAKANAAVLDLRILLQDG